MSEYGHLLPAYRRHAALADAERIAWIRADRWLEFERARGALARLEDLLAYPPRDRMPCLLLYGDTGMGKTKIIRKFLRDHPATFDKATGVTTMPVVAMQMPAEPIERDIYGELLVSLGRSGTDRRRDAPAEGNLPRPPARHGRPHADHRRDPRHAGRQFPAAADLSERHPLPGE